MLDARQLEAFAAVVEHGSFGAAAKALKLTLAAVSLRIKSLEASIGKRLLVRGKQVYATSAGQALLGHVKRVKLLEADLLDAWQGTPPGADKALQSLSVAVNADSLASWFLPGVAAALQKHRLLLDIVIDDQDHTHDALGRGDVVGCVTTLAPVIRGCVAEPLGVMRYRCMASSAFIARWGVSRMAVDGHNDVEAPAHFESPHQLLSSPAVIFNRKDNLQDAYLAQHFNIHDASYPRHFVPAVDAYEAAQVNGLGWGMVPELLLAARPQEPALQEVLPGCPLDVMLYWQHWAGESAAAQLLTQAVKQAAREYLLPAPS